jgi:hypothetical protein
MQIRNNSKQKKTRFEKFSMSKRVWGCIQVLPYNLNRIRIIIII